jgi:hypothetical protein
MNDVKDNCVPHLVSSDMLFRRIYWPVFGHLLVEIETLTIKLIESGPLSFLVKSESLSSAYQYL